MASEFPLSDMQKQRIEKCRLHYNAFTGSNLSFSEYFNDLLSSAIRNEEKCCKAAKNLAPVRLAHVN